MTESFGNFELGELLGRGGMAEVFRARALNGPLEGQVVALKRLRPKVAEDERYVDLFLGEADVTRQLDHPSIVKVFETGAVDGTYYIAMEIIDGIDLDQMLNLCRDEGKLIPINLACYLTDVVAGALSYVHTAVGPSGSPLALVHCDVTPSNVFVAKSGDIRLTDFGVAQAQAIGNPLEEIGVAGKASYMAPEQILQESITPATDVFALGAIFYELLTLTRAFNGDKPEDIWDPWRWGPPVGPRLLWSSCRGRIL